MLGRFDNDLVRTDTAHHVEHTRTGTLDSPFDPERREFIGHHADIPAFCIGDRIFLTISIFPIETINTFSVRYQISDKWQLKSESGEHQGADLLYTIERE